MAKKKIGDKEATPIIKAEYQAMSHEEIVEATSEHAQVLKEDKKTKLTGGHNRSITEFHDTMANLRAIEDKVRCSDSFFSFLT